ncbi:MAG: hypothetical protein ACTHJ5_17400 [Ilyomonas sp.]
MVNEAHTMVKRVVLETKRAGGGNKRCAAVKKRVSTGKKRTDGDSIRVNVGSKRVERDSKREDSVTIEAQSTQKETICL